jgi:hypothetical protein
MWKPHYAPLRRAASRVSGQTFPQIE